MLRLDSVNENQASEISIQISESIAIKNLLLQVKCKQSRRTNNGRV